MRGTPVTTQSYYVDQALLAEGWCEGVRISVTPTGMIDTIETKVAAGAIGDGTDRLDGALLPGRQNCHGVTTGVFKSAAAPIRDPDGLEAAAALAYMALVELGFTAVGDVFALPYEPASADPDLAPALAFAMIRAALDVRIGLTLFPLAVPHPGGDAAGRPPGDDPALAIWRACHRSHKGDRQIRTGLGLLVREDAPTDQFAALLAAVHGQDAWAPIQVLCADPGQAAGRALDRLLDQAPVDGRWSLVWNDAVTGPQAAAVAALDAVVVVPFGADPAAIGAALPGERLAFGTCNVAFPTIEHLAEAPPAPAKTGAQVLARPIGGLAPGNRADWILSPERGSGRIDRGWCGGAGVGAAGRHQARDSIIARYHRLVGPPG